MAEEYENLPPGFKVQGTGPQGMESLPPGFKVGSGIPTQRTPPALTPGMVETGPAGAAGIGDVAIASLAEDPKAQIRWYSKQMNIPEDRFGMIEGEIVYLNDAGKLQYVAPGSLRKTAGGLGPAVPALGGALGSIGGMAVSAPTGPGMFAGAAIGGATGAGAGQAGREWLSSKLMDQEFSELRVGREVAYDMGATLGGLLIGKGWSRAMATKAGKELTRLMKTTGRVTMENLQAAVAEINRKYRTNIKLTPAELSNVAELRGQQMALESTPRTSTQLEDYYVGRGAETEKAMKGYLGEVSPVTDPDIAGEGLSQSADRAMKEIVAERTRLGSPAYQKAFEDAGERGGVDIIPVLDTIEEQIATGPKAIKSVLETVRRDLYDEVYDPVTKQMGYVEVNDLEVLQNRVKESLDDEIRAAFKSGRSKLGFRLKRVMDSLLKQMDESSPKFKDARALWGDLSGPVTQAEGGVLPMLSKKTAKDFEYLGTKFFGRSSPSEITRARARILATDGGEDSWNAALRGFFEQRWDEAGRVFKSKIARPGLAKGAQPAAFWAEMVGAPGQKLRLKAAMSNDQYRAFEVLMDVFEATGRASNYNSTTAAQLAGREMLDTQTSGGKILKTAVNPLGLPRRTEDFLNETIRNKNLDEVVAVITRTDSVEELLKVASRSTPRDKRWLVVAKVLNLARAEATAGDNQTFAPPAMSQPIGP